MQKPVDQPCVSPHWLVREINRKGVVGATFLSDSTLLIVESTMSFRGFRQVNFTQPDFDSPPVLECLNALQAIPVMASRYICMIYQADGDPTGLACEIRDTNLNIVWFGRLPISHAFQASYNEAHQSILLSGRPDIASWDDPQRDKSDVVFEINLREGVFRQIPANAAIWLPDGLVAWSRTSDRVTLVSKYPQFECEGFCAPIRIINKAARWIIPTPRGMVIGLTAAVEYAPHDTSTSPFTVDLDSALYCMAGNDRHVLVCGFGPQGHLMDLARCGVGELHVGFDRECFSVATMSQPTETLAVTVGLRSEGHVSCVRIWNIGNRKGGTAKVGTAKVSGTVV